MSPIWAEGCGRNAPQRHGASLFKRTGAKPASYTLFLYPSTCCGTLPGAASRFWSFVVFSTHALMRTTASHQGRAVHATPELSTPSEHIARHCLRRTNTRPPWSPAEFTGFGSLFFLQLRLPSATLTPHCFPPQPGNQSPPRPASNLTSLD